MSQIHKIGDLKICTQALLVLVAGIVLAIISFILQPEAAPTIVLMLVVIFVSAYAINCTVVGNCEIFGWILSVFYVILLMSGMYIHGNAFKLPEHIKDMIIASLTEVKDVTGQVVEDVAKGSKSVIKSAKGAFRV